MIMNTIHYLNNKKGLNKMINRFVVNTISDKTGKLVCYETVRTEEDALRVVKRYAAIKGITNEIQEVSK